MDAKKYRMLYMGTPSMSAGLLKYLLESNWNVIGVVTNPDKPQGRKQILTPSPVKEVALEHNIPVYQPIKIRKDYEWAKDLNIDVILTFAYGQIVPEAFLQYARLGAYNVHGSLLPAYRGAAPVQRAIMNGDSELGVTLMKMVKEMDAGKMYGKESFSLPSTANCGDAFELLKEAGIRLVEKYLPPVLLAKEEGVEIGVPQDTSLVTIASKISPEEEHLPLHLSVKDTLNYIRALAPEPGAYLFFRSNKLKIYEAKEVKETFSLPAGSLISYQKNLVLVLEKGAISLIKVQLAGKKEMEGKSFLNGARLQEGEMAD